MAVDFRDEAPAILKDYLIYKQTIKNMSKKTVDEYFIDLRTFFRFLKVMRGLVPDGTESVHRHNNALQCQSCARSCCFFSKGS